MIGWGTYGGLWRWTQRAGREPAAATGFSTWPLRRLACLAGEGRPKITPAPLFQWLIVALLFSARISADTAEKAAKALFNQGWTTPEKMALTSWEQRVRVLNGAGYARYDESTSRYIGATTDLLLERYGGDLRRLREEAGHDPEEERKRLKAFKGIGEIGCDIFFWEAQRAWDEI